jgi:hypothetical protein
MSKTAARAKLKELLYELAQSGSPLDPSVAETEVENEKVEIDQVGGMIESQLFELEDGRVACIADIAVTNQTSRTIYVVDVELRVPWDNSLFKWLTPHQVKPQDRAKRESAYSVYRFPGKYGLELAYNEVINHLLLERKRLPAKLPLEGCLLGIGGLMPPGLRHGQWRDVTLTIVGSDHAEYSRTIHLWTDRLQARTKIVKTRTPIFASLVEEETILAQEVTDTTPLPASQSPASNKT